jgi:hypothetical protein
MGDQKLYEDRNLTIICECKSVTSLFLFKQGGMNEHLEYVSLKKLQSYYRLTCLDTVIYQL